MNKGDAASEATFKLVNEAYAVLSDDKERQLYNTLHRFAGLHHTINSARPQYYAGNQQHNNKYDPNNIYASSSTTFTRNPFNNTDNNTYNTNRPFNLNEFLDYNEWYRMQYGMDEKQKEAYMNEKLKEGKKQGFANFNDPNASANMNYEARRAARFAAAAQQKVERGYSETHRYRQWAHNYRANVAASERAWPLTMVAWGMVFGGFYMFAQRLWENHR